MGSQIHGWETHVHAEIEVVLPTATELAVSLLVYESGKPGLVSHSLLCMVQQRGPEKPATPLQLLHFFDCYGKAFASSSIRKKLLLGCIQDFVNDPVFLGLKGTHVEIAIGIATDTLQGLAGMEVDNVIQLVTQM
jgi:hypothetical protein